MNDALPEWWPTDPAEQRSCAELGEDAVIAAIRAISPSDANGNDAAAISLAQGVVGTDMSVEGRHFLRTYSRPFEVGAKVTVQNLADIVAMGAKPTAITLALGVPGSTPIGVVKDIVRGIDSVLRPHNISLIGGDLTQSPQIVLSITAMGKLVDKPIGFNAGISGPGYFIINGNLGHSAAGLALLAKGVKCGHVDGVLDDGRSYADGSFDRLIALHRCPSLDMNAGVNAARAGARALTDCSDGFMKDAGTLARASGVSIYLDEEQYPLIDEALRVAANYLGESPYDWILNGGEDHALLGIIGDTQPLPEGYRIIGTTRPSVEPGIYLNGEAITSNHCWESFS
ncbi:MAG: AIR synthase related protein [Corynebacterium sp.]|nr:AIR synthase related protein [Corynebacterium sp.]